MPFPKQQLRVLAEHDGRNFTLLEPLEFIADDGTHYRAAAGSTTDGASTPQAIWINFPPFGKYWLPAVLHDAAYRGSLEVLGPDGQWRMCLMPKDQADDLLLEAMEDQQVGHFTRQTIYEAVKHFGEKSFETDRSGSPFHDTSLEPLPELNQKT